MYCPSCSQSYGATYSRCPECHCWLKPTAPQLVGVEAGSGESGDFSSESGSSKDGWRSDSSQSLPSKAEWSAQNQAPGPTSWGMDALAESEAQKDGWGNVPPLESQEVGIAETKTGWLSEPQKSVDPQDGWGWKPESETAKPTPELDEREWVDDDEVEQFDDDWVDESLDDYEFDSADGDRTLYVHEALPSNSQANFAVGLVFVALLVVGAIAFKDRAVTTDVDPSTKVVQEEKEALDSAKIWSQSAQESMAEENYDLAITQMEEALGYYQKSGLEPQELLVHQRVLAGAQELKGDLPAAYKTWMKIVKVDPALEPEAGRVAKAIRKKAAALNQEAKTLLGKNKTRDGREKAESAYKLFKAHQGQRDQLALSLELIGQSHLDDNNILSATEFYKRANQLDPNDRRAKILRELAPTRPGVDKPRPNPGPSSPSRPTFSIDDGNDVPQGTRPGHRPRPNPSKPVESGNGFYEGDVAPPKPQPGWSGNVTKPRPQPNKPPRPGSEGVIPGYDS